MKVCWASYFLIKICWGPYYLLKLCWVSYSLTKSQQVYPKEILGSNSLIKGILFCIIASMDCFYTVLSDTGYIQRYITDNDKQSLIRKTTISNDSKDKYFFFDFYLRPGYIFCRLLVRLFVNRIIQGVTNVFSMIFFFTIGISPLPWRRYELSDCFWLSIKSPAVNGVQTAQTTTDNQRHGRQPVTFPKL